MNGYLLDSAGDTDYVDYDQRINELRRFFLSLDQGDWTRNLYWSWLYALRPLLEPCGPGYPPFMRTLAWQDKQLNSALCSWTELRHDTILYAKQSTTPASGFVIDHTTAGYVEPVPEVFERLRALAQLTRTGLDNLSVLDPGSEARLILFESTLARLRDIAVAELQNQPLSASDSDYICNFFMLLSELSDPAADPLTENTTLVADVHTDANTGMVLEEGVGNVKLLVAACALPQIGTFLAAGPVLTGYEFKWAMGNRLTDAAWSSLLASSNAPAAPGWTSSFMDPVTILTGADASPLQLGRSGLAADGFHLCWQDDPARRYRALFSDDLSNWFLLQTPSPAQAGAAQMVDPAATNSSHRFYSLKPVPN